MAILDESIAALISRDDARAESVVPQLAALGNEALAALKPLLDSSDEDARWWAVRTLAQMNPAPLTLIRAALKDDSADVRQCAALGLAHHPHPDSIPALIAALDDKDGMVVTLVANALSAIGSEAVPSIIAALKAERLSTRIEAARALAGIKDYRSIPALMKALEEDSAVMQYWATQGLDKLGLGMVYLKPE